MSRHARERVGYVTQAPSVYGDLTVHENLELLRGDRRGHRFRVAEVLEAVGSQGARIS